MHESKKNAFAPVLARRNVKVPMMRFAYPDYETILLSFIFLFETKFFLMKLSITNSKISVCVENINFYNR